MKLFSINFAVRLCFGPSTQHFGLVRLSFRPSKIILTSISTTLLSTFASLISATATLRLEPILPTNNFLKATTGSVQFNLLSVNSSFALKSSELAPCSNYQDDAIIQKLTFISLI